jgi:hypothetical protein
VTSLDIEVAAAARRRVVLVRQQRQLLRKIRHKQTLLAKLELEHDRAQSWLCEHVAPIWDDCRRMNDEVLEAFEALFSNGPTKRARRSVRDVYRALLRRGILSPREDSAFDDDECRADEGAPHVTGNAPPDEAELRVRFRRVALALHPDRVQDEGEKERRTEMMKDFTRAFESRDLAGLLNLEPRWTLGEGDARAERETDLDALARVVAELQAQLAAVRHRCQSVQDSGVLALFLDASRELSRAGRTGLDRLVDAARGDLEELTRIRDLVAAFERKEISLAQFLAGPTFRFAGAEFDLEDLVSSLTDELDERPRRRRSRGRGG